MIDRSDVGHSADKSESLPKPSTSYRRCYARSACRWLRIAYRAWKAHVLGPQARPSETGRYGPRKRRVGIEVGSGRKRFGFRVPVELGEASKGFPGVVVPGCRREGLRMAYRGPFFATAAIRRENQFLHLRRAATKSNKMARATTVLVFIRWDRRDGSRRRWLLGATCSPWPRQEIRP